MRHVYKMRYIYGIIFSILPLLTFGQGDNYILLSKTGDTLITRTSCYCKTKDTLTTYFNILDNVSGNLRLISVFEIQEPGKNSIPCADFNLVPQDTLAKYGLKNLGRLGTMPQKFNIKSKVIKVDTATTDKGKFIYYRQIRHQFRIGWKTFYRSTVWDATGNKRDKIEKPKISKVYGSTDLKKYHFVVIIKNVDIDRKTGKDRTTFSHTRIIN